MSHECEDAGACRVVEVPGQLTHRHPYEGLGSACSQVCGGVCYEGSKPLWQIILPDKGAFNAQ